MSIEKFKNKNGKIWLNIASSVYTLDGFINLESSVFLRFAKMFYMFKFIIPEKYHEWIDLYKNLKEKEIFIVHDCRKPLPFPDGSVDHILCSHFLEHVFKEEMEKIISDFYRVLKNGGTLHVIVPNIQWMVNEYLFKKRNGVLSAADWFLKETILSRETRGSFKYRAFEFLGMFGLQHRWMYDYDSMELNLIKSGFTILKENNSPSKHYQLDKQYKAVNILAKKIIV
jgi:predicted SAM-dependent methyltransferase